jgi:hypothetical protein
MGTINRSLSFPLDEDGFLRRECPFCKREFKVGIPPEERAGSAESVPDSFMLSDDQAAVPEQEEQGTEYHCPYCGQTAGKNSWWTQEQVAYIHTVLQNVAAELINENLIRPLKRSLGRPKPGLITVTFQGREIDHQEEWLPAEPNDMTRSLLACCDREIKISDDWSGRVHCYFCGFPHEGQTEADELAR